MSTYALIVNGVAVEVGVQDYPPIRDDGSPDTRFKEVEDGVGVGWSTSDGGKTWQEPPQPAPVPAVTVDITPEQYAAAVQTLQAILDPAVANPSLAVQANALAVIIASGPLAGP